VGGAHKEDMVLGLGKMAWCCPSSPLIICTMEMGHNGSHSGPQSLVFKQPAHIWVPWPAR